MPKQSNFASFKRAARAEFGRFKQKIVMQKRNMTLFAIDQVQQRAPVRTGGMREAWEVTFGGPSHNVYQKGKDPGSTEDPRAKAAQISWETGPVHIGNTHFAFRWVELGGFVPSDPGPSRDRYIDILGRKRFGEIWVAGGFSTQAPEGVIGPVVERMRRKFAKYTPTVN